MLLECFWSALGVVLWECSWNGALRVLLELDWCCERVLLEGCPDRVFRRGVLGGFWRGVPEGFLERCSWLEESFRRSQKGAVAHHIIIVTYHPLALSGSLYPDILGIVIAMYYDFCVF